MVFALLFDVRNNSCFIERNVVVEHFIPEKYHIYGRVSVKHLEFDERPLFGLNFCNGSCFFIQDNARISEIFLMECEIAPQENISVIEFFSKSIESLKSSNSHSDFSAALQQLEDWTISPFELQCLHKFKIYEVFRKFAFFRLSLGSCL